MPQGWIRDQVASRAKESDILEHGARHLGPWRRTALDILEHGVRQLGAKRTISGDLGAWRVIFCQVLKDVRGVMNVVLTISHTLDR